MKPMMAGVQQTLNLRAFWKSAPGLDVVKIEKCSVFKFVLRPYYVPDRFSQRLAHSR